MPIITLLTDFGTEDGYVGQMKGVILSRNPSVTIVDITHDIQYQNVQQAAFVLYTTHKFFPSGTIHVVIIDPGVGSSRKALAVAADQSVFLAPDNGLLQYIYADFPRAEKYQLDRTELFLETVSNTFHGRDIFAPVAARISNGTPLQEIGSPLSEVEAGHIAKPEIASGSIRGSIMHVDHFGNLVTNIRGAEVMGKIGSGDLVMIIQDHSFGPVLTSYADGERGKPMMIVGSHGFLEVAVSMGNAMSYFGCRIGDSAWVTVKEAGK